MNSGHHNIYSQPGLAGWIQSGDRWGLWWNGREVASLCPDKAGGLRLHLDARKMWQAKEVRVASVRQGKRFAERWCAARLRPDLPLREAVGRLVAGTRPLAAAPLPGLPPTLEQQQARRLAEATAAATALVKDALAPRPPLNVVTRPQPGRRRTDPKLTPRPR